MERIMRRIMVLVISVAFTCGSAFPVFAQTTLDDVLKRVEALEKQNAAIEKENAALKAEVMALKDKQSAQETKIAAVQVVPGSAAPASSGNFLKTGPEVTLYGFVKADAVFSSRDMGNAAVSTTQISAARPNSTSNGTAPEFQASAQDTRLGLKFKAPDLDNGGKLTGQFEMDFAGTSTVGTYQPRLRLAFAQIDFDKWGVNAGQNWDIFAPLSPNTLNPGVLYHQGNLGTRHPQATLINKWGTLLGGNVTTKVGLIDADDPLIEDSGMPVGAAYASYERKILGVKSTFGLGGMYGRLNLPTSGTAKDPIYATTGGMTLTFTDWLKFQVEGYAGTGLNKFQGGPAQTTAFYSATTFATPKPIGAKGGFLELTYNPIKKWESNVGFGIDDVNEDMTFNTTTDKSTTTTVWSSNKTYYTNLKYSLSKDLLVGIEYQLFQTKWLDGSQASDNRVQTSLIYKF